MVRWLLLGVCVVASACKVVTSTGEGAGDGGVTPGRPYIGFATTNVVAYESSGQAFVELTMTKPSSDPVTFTYLTTDGSAVQGLDYEAQHDTVTIDPGSTEYAIYIPIIADAVDENDEAFSVYLTNVTGASVGRGSSQVTISSNHRPTVGFSIASQLQPEGVPGSMVLTLSEPSSLPISVTYTLDGTATPNLDYYVADAPAGPLPIPYTPPPFMVPAGQTYSYLPISPYNDDVDESDETIIATLLAVSNAEIGSNYQSTYTIKDDDTPPAVSFEQFDYAFNEGTGSQVQATVWVYLSATATTPVDVSFTIDDAASTASPDDYTLAVTSPLTIPAGENRGSITFTLNGDSIIEGTEYVTFHLTNATNATLGSLTTARMTIYNDDCLGTGSFAICPYGTLLGDVALPADLDTDTSGFCDYGYYWANGSGPSSCVVFARNISVGSTKVHGWRPLVLAATQSIDVATSLDVTPLQGYYVPGGAWANCSGNSAGLQSGGAGGSFMTAGGNGGAHTNPTGAGSLAAPAQLAPTYLRAGCTGILGGDNTLSTSGGRGGGAVFLGAGSSITIHAGAVVNASGEPGQGSSELSVGGSGGGTGGMIVFDAPSIIATGALILANGAGGAEGGASSQGGKSGSAPDPLSPLTPAPGGTGTQGGNGGNGFAQGSPATAGATGNNNNGGGGGGGGAGYIHTTKALTGATVSPGPS